LHATQFFAFSKVLNLCAELVVGSNGNIYCAMGDVKTPSTPDLVAYSSTGEILWNLNRILIDSHATFVGSLYLSPSGRLLVVRQTYPSASEPRIEAYNPLSGDLLWILQPNILDQSSVYVTTVGWSGSSVVYTYSYYPQILQLNCLFFAVNYTFGTMVWKSDEYEKCIVDPQKSAVIDYRKDGTNNSDISLLYATVNHETLRIVDCHQGKVITDFNLTRQSPLQTGFIVDREGSLYYVSNWPFSNPQYTSYGVCKLPAYPLMNDSAPLWCVETDSIESSGGGQFWNGVLRFDEAHNRVVLSSIVFPNKFQHKVRSIDASTGKVIWTTLIPAVENHDGSQHESLAIDEKGNYYFTHDCCFLSIIHWDTGNITTTLRVGEDPVNLLAIGAGRLYISDVNGLRMWQTVPEPNPTLPWYESVYALLGFTIAGSLLVVIIIGLMTCYYSRSRHLDYSHIND